MNNRDFLLHCYELIIKDKANETIKMILDEVENKLKSIHSAADGRREEIVFNSLWEDISMREQLLLANCDSWAECNCYICELIEDQIKNYCSETDVKMIWLQTEMGEDWKSDTESYQQEEDNQKLNDIIGIEYFCPYYKEDEVTEYIYNQLMVRAINYSNAIIGNYSDGLDI